MAAYASHLVLLSVSVNYRSPRPRSTTLKLNRSQGQTMIRIRIQSLDRIEKHLMTWQIAIKTRSARPARSSSRRKKGVEEQTPTASSVSSLDPSSLSPSLFASPLPPGSDSQFRSYQHQRCVRKHTPRLTEKKNTNLFLNSSGTDDGSTSAFDLAAAARRSCGFSSWAVREGRET